MKLLIGLALILAWHEPAWAMTFSLPATSSQFLPDRASKPSVASHPSSQYNPALAAGLSYLPGIAAGALTAAILPPGTSLNYRLLFGGGVTLFNPLAGLGQLYVNEPGRAFNFLAGNLVASYVAGTAAVAAGMMGTSNTAEAVGVMGLLMLPVGISTWAAYDAYRLAEEKNASAAKLPSPETK